MQLFIMFWYLAIRLLLKEQFEPNLAMKIQVLLFIVVVSHACLRPPVVLKVVNRSNI